MPTAGLPLFTSTASLITKGSTPKPLIFGGATSSVSRKFHEKSMSCKASSSSSSSSYSVTNLDLYDLLGIESSSNQSQIKMAYRTLQKRCHPDIAGEAGHDMAIILNEAYALLSDPNSRSAYDKEQAKISELRGYTGKPIYSVWFGSESEERAVFVDEVKCVGCLKCALSANKTFAIESVYGRARVVAQWADPEYKIKEAIDACPVDCISVVERSNLAALEFLMSKQPRGNVRMSEGNAGGTSGTNIFVDVKKFQTRFQDAMDKASTQHSKETDLEREARMSAVQAIRSISNWLYWQSPNARATSETQNLTHIAQKPNEPNIKKLRDAAAARKRAGESTRPRRQRPSNYIYHEDYWIPSTHALPFSTMDSSSSVNASETSPTSEWKETKNKYYREQENNRSSPIRWGIPIVTGATAAFKVWLQIGEGAVGGLKEHIGGSLALEIVNSSLLQVMLAGIMWYIMGAALVEIIEGIGNTGSGVKDE